MLTFFHFRCVFIVLILIRQCLGTTLEDLDSRELLQVQAAYQKPIYNNIGKLVRRGNDGHIYPLGSVVYIKNRICLAAAHCMVNRENIDLSVEFESEGSLKTYNIIKSRIHGKYVITNLNHDIAILKLDRCMEGIEGVEPYYDYEAKVDFIDDVESGVNNNPDILTYVGYGSSTMVSMEFMVYPKTFRKVCHGYAMQSCRNFIASGYNRMRSIKTAVDIANKTRTWISRDPIYLEVIPTKGMSGGGVFDENDHFIGLISGEKALPFYKRSLINRVRFLNTVIVNFRLCLPIPLIPYPYFCEQGNGMKSASLGYHKDWIEQNISEFTKDDELLQDLTIQDLKTQEVLPIKKQGTLKEWGEEIMRGDVYAIVLMAASVASFIYYFSLAWELFVWLLRACHQLGLNNS